jgi:prephenate dehydrogenase
VTVLIIGTGLIGTSIGLALSHPPGRPAGSLPGSHPGSEQVWLTDADPASAELAASLGAGAVLAGSMSPVDIAVIAVPPDAVAATLADAQARGLARWYTDVASVKQLPVAQARAIGCDMRSYVPGHPLAGREKHGPAAARTDLFLGRTWALCPSADTDPEAVFDVTTLAKTCGAVPLTTDPAAHDRWVALTSHAPHLIAAAMAARLESAPAQALDLAGQGLRDVTRIAAGDTGMWTQILAANAVPVAEVLDAVAADLAQAARTLAESDPKHISDLLDRGRAGVARIPGKHGAYPSWQGPREFAVIAVLIRDEPGELMRLFEAAGAAGVNIEDIRIEHSPGLPLGTAELSVRPAETTALLDALQAGGWPVKTHLFRTGSGARDGFLRVRGASRIPAEDPQEKYASAEEIQQALQRVTSGQVALDPAVQHLLIKEVAGRAAEPGARADGLTPREAEVLILIAEGLSNTEIAARLVVSEATVKSHINHLLPKIGARDRAQAVSYAYRTGLA